MPNIIADVIRSLDEQRAQHTPGREVLARAVRRYAQTVSERAERIDAVKKRRTERQSHLSPPPPVSPRDHRA
jgi:hypothetical protein